MQGLSAPLWLGQFTNSLSHMIKSQAHQKQGLYPCKHNTNLRLEWILAQNRRWKITQVGHWAQMFHVVNWLEVKHNTFPSGQSCRYLSTENNKHCAYIFYCTSLYSAQHENAVTQEQKINFRDLHLFWVHSLHLRQSTHSKHLSQEYVICRLLH